MIFSYKSKLSHISLVFIFHLTSFLAHAENKIIENFQTKKEGQFPKEFLSYPFQRQKVFKIYHVQKEEENLFLHAQDVPGMTNQVFKKFEWDPQEQSLFSWKWRALSLPKQGAENVPSSNDSACAVYLAFGGWGGKAIKYVWSSTLAPGTVIEVTPNKYYMVVVESGERFLNQWKSEVVDVSQEFKKYFKGDFQNPKGFGLLTDGDQTQSESACDYDDFKALESKATQANQKK